MQSSLIQVHATENITNFMIITNVNIILQLFNYNLVLVDL